MIAAHKPFIEPLTSGYERATFRCGEPALDAYLRERAMQDMRRRVAQVFVARGQTPNDIAGYYTLSASSIQRESLSPAIARKLPRYPVPVAIIGRLAIGAAYQAQKLGGYLLIDAANRILGASSTLAIHAIIVGAKNDRAYAFYRRFGFEPLPDTPLRLFMPLEDFVKGGL